MEDPYASDLPRALKARIRPVLNRQAAASAVVEEAPEHAAAAADTRMQVTPPLLPLQGSPVEENKPELGNRRPREVAAPAEHVAVKRVPEAKVDTQSVKPVARDVTVAPLPDENRLDRPAHPSRAYSLAYVAVFAGAALFATGHVLGLRMRGRARWRVPRSKPG